MISEELTICMQGIVPSIIVTADADEMPNATIISQVYYVDSQHVAISNQFFSKTFKNLQFNKNAVVQIWNPENFSSWVLTMHLVRVEEEGDLFDEMEMQLEAIASMTGMQDIFKLKSAYIFEVTEVLKQDEA